MTRPRRETDPTSTPDTPASLVLALNFPFTDGAMFIFAAPFALALV